MAVTLNRTKDSYIREWKAHNFVFSIMPFGTIGERTRSVNLNYNEEDDKYSWAYQFFG